MIVVVGHVKTLDTIVCECTVSSWPRTSIKAASLTTRACAHLRNTSIGRVAIKNADTVSVIMESTVGILQERKRYWAISQTRKLVEDGIVQVKKGFVIPISARARRFASGAVHALQNKLRLDQVELWLEEQNMKPT